jgi:hypothetical protein
MFDGKLVPVSFIRNIEIDIYAANFCGDAFAVFGIDVANDDMRTFICKAASDCLANTARTPRYEGGFIL